jgi:hypothetical protein
MAFILASIRCEKRDRNKESEKNQISYYKPQKPSVYKLGMRYDRPPGLDTDDSLATRQNLLSRLKNWDDSGSWNDFFRTYWNLIFNVAQAGLTEVEAQDVVQQTVIEVSNQIGEFKHNREGSFKKWLLQKTHWRIQDQFRKRLPGETKVVVVSEDDEGANFLDQIPDPSGSLLEQT